MCRRPLGVLIGVLVLFTSLHSLHAERELEFAVGLKELQLFDLSFEQFKKVLADKGLSEENRIEAELAFADAYMAAADCAEKPYIKDKYFDLAATQLDEFLKNHPKVSQANDVRFKKATLQQTRATEISRSLLGIRDKNEAAPLVQKAEKLFQDAITQFNTVGQLCQGEMEKISGIERDKKRIERREAMMKEFLLATNQAAWTHFYWAELYERPIVADAGKQKQQIDQSMASFKKYVDDYGNFVIALSGRIGLGACLAKLGDMDVDAYEKSQKKDTKRRDAALKNYETARDEFLRVTQRRPTKEANPFRFHAYSLMGETYNKMGKLDPSKEYFDDAIKQVNILVEQLPEDLIFQEATDAAMQQEQLTLKKAMLEKGAAFLHLAKDMKPEDKKKTLEKGVKAFNDVIKAGGPMARIATEMRNEWGATYPELKQARTPGELIGVAKQKFDEAEKIRANPATQPQAGAAYQAAVRAYEQVIIAADPDDDAAFIGESWQQIGLGYFQQGRFFEAAVAFSEVPEILPDHPKAADIAFASTQLFGHVLDQEHFDELLLRSGDTIQGKIAGADKANVTIQVAGEEKPQVIPLQNVDKERRELPLDHMMDIYVSALEKFARAFPDDKRATEAVFRSGDALRAGGRFGQAAKLYETIPSHAQQYEKASYLAGQCYWAAYLAALAADATKSKEADPLWRKAAERLTGYLKWAAEQPEISPEYTRLKRYWMAKARLRLASVYSYETVREFQRALDILQGFEQTFFGELQEQAKVFHKEAVDLQNQKAQLEAKVAEAKKAKKPARDLESQLQLVNIELEQRIGTLKEIGGINNEIATYRINSYAGLGELEQAKAEFEKLKNVKMDDIEKSKLSRVLAMGYLNHVDKLKEKKAPEAELKKAQDEAAKFVLNLIQLNPNLSATDLVWYGSRLFALGHQEDASKVFQMALAKFEQAGQKYSPPYWDVVRRIANAYEEAELWEPAMTWERALLGWEKIFILCVRNFDLAKSCFEDKTKGGQLLATWEDREKRGEWLICLLLSNATYADADATFRDDAKRAKALAEWKKKGSRDQAFAKWGVKEFDPMRMGLGPELRRRLAYATEKSGKFADALALWESLGNDIQRGGPVWLDAKYHEVLCLLTLKKEDEAKTVMSSVMIPYPKLGGEELEQKFLTMMKEKFSKENYEALTKTREAALDESKVAGDLKKEDQKALDSYRTDKGKKDKKK